MLKGQIPISAKTQEKYQHAFIVDLPSKLTNTSVKVTLLATMFLYIQIKPVITKNTNLNNNNQRLFD